IAAELVVELSGADVHRVDARRTALQQAVGEAARGRADVDADPAADRRAELVERVRELLATPADVGRAPADLDLGGGLDERAGLVHATTVDEDLSGHDAAGCLLAAGQESFVYEEFVESNPRRHAII